MQIHEAQPLSLGWMFSFKDPMQLWTDNWFALVLEIVSAAILFQVFRNAKKRDPQSAYLILAAITAAVTTEMLPFMPRRPGYLLWWYHQGVVNVLKQRVPSYVISVYALVFYMAHCLTSKSDLPSFTRSIVTAVSASLIMFPCLWLAPRLLLLLLHFDDAVFKDQIVGVPYFQLVVSILLFFHTSHVYHQNFVEIEPKEKNTYGYIKCGVQSGLVAGIYPIVEQYLLYMLLKLILNVNTGYCLVAAVLVLLCLARREIKKMQMVSYSIQGISSPLMRKEWWVVVVTMVFLSTLPLWLNTQNLKSTSDRLELGPCNITHNVSNTSPLEMPRRRYVCPDDANHLNFDFHCTTREDLLQGVKKRTKHYIICGKKFENSQRITKLFLMYSACCVVLFYIIMMFSFTFKVQEKKILNGCEKVE